MAPKLPDDTLLDAALAYASQGFPVVPVHFSVATTSGHQGCSCELRATCKEVAGHSLLEGRDFEPTTRDTQIKLWWSKWPFANVGLATERFHAIEVKDGAAMRRLTDALAGARVASGPVIKRENGSWYALFQPLETTGTRELLRGVRWIGDGGLVVAPPSSVIDGRPDTWLRALGETPLPPVPRDLERLVLREPARRAEVRFGLT